MARNRTVKVVILGDSKDAQKSFKDLNKGAKKSGEQFSKTGSAIKGAMGVVAAGAVVMFGKEMAELGARNEAIMRRTDTVFGDSAGTIKQWATDSASAFGLSETGVLNLASSFGDLLIPMGFTRAETTEMTRETLEAANALSEWTGGQVSTTQAAEAVSKAMLGEREQLKSLGISILEADVQQRLLEKGQKELTGTALQQAKAIATQELVFEKSTDALTAYADGGDNALRSQKDLASQSAELKDDLAKTLAPAISGVVDGLGDMAAGAEALMDWFDGLDDTGKKVALTIGGVAAALALVYANPILAGLALVAGAIMLVGKQAKEAEDRVDAMAGAIEELGSHALVKGIANLRNESTTLAETMGYFGVTVEDVSNAMRGGEPAFDRFLANLAESDTDLVRGSETAEAMRGELDDLAEAYWTASQAIADEERALQLEGEAADRAERQLRRNQQSTGKLAKATDTAADSTDDLTGSTWDLEAATSDAEQAQIDLADQQRKAADPVFALRDAQDAYADALATVNQLEAEGKTATEEYEQAQWDLIEAQGDLNYEQERVAATSEVTLAAFVKTAREAGLTEAQIKDLVDQVGIYNNLSPESKTFSWLFDVTGSKPKGFSPSGIPYFDRGGVVPGPIGSPQLAVVHGGETVLPTHKTGVTAPQSVSIGVYLDSRELVRAIEVPLMDRIKIKAGIRR